MKNVFFVCSVGVCVWEEDGGRRGKGGWLRGGGAEPRKVGELKGGGRRVGGGERKEQHFAHRSSFPGANFVLSSLSGDLLVELWPWFEAVGHKKCSFGLLWRHLLRAPGGLQAEKGKKTETFLAVQRRGFQRHKEHTTQQKKNTEKNTEKKNTHTHTQKQHKHTHTHTQKTHTHTHTKNRTKKKENIAPEKKSGPAEVRSTV